MNWPLIFRIAELRFVIPAWFWRLECRLRGARLGQRVRLVGRPILRMYPGSAITLGDETSFFSGRNTNPLGLFMPCVIRTQTPAASIVIHRKSGMSGAVICAASKVEIGQNTIIGAGALIIDNDFHQLTDHGWTNAFAQTARPVSIGSRVFIGARAIILKGVTIGDDCTIGAGSVVARDIPAGSVAVGNPAKVVGQRAR